MSVAHFISKVETLLILFSYLVLEYSMGHNSYDTDLQDNDTHQITSRSCRFCFLWCSIYMYKIKWPGIRSNDLMRRTSELKVNNN